MLRIIGLELKLQLKAKKTIGIFLTGVIMSVLIAVLSINTATSRNIILNEENQVEYSSGKISVDYLKKTQKTYEGLLTEEKCVEIVEKYQEILNEYDGREENIPHDIYAKEITPMIDILNVISYSFTTSYDGELDKNGTFPKDFQAEEAKAVYRERLKALKKIWETKYVGREQISEKLESREENIRYPLYFANYSGWDSLQSNLALVLIPIIVLLSCLLTAPVFSKHYENDSDRVFRATRFGRHTLAMARIMSSMILTTLLYIFTIGICITICSFVFNRSGLKTSIQFIDLFASSNLNIGQLVFITILGGLLATCTMAMFAICLSSAMKSSIVVLASSFFVIVVNMILNIFTSGNINDNMLYFIINTFSPYSAASLSSSIVSNAYAYVGNSIVWLPAASIFFTIVIIISGFGLCLKRYNNYQN